VVSDPQKCTGARFTCNQSEEYFSDAQGCGCQPATVTTPVVMTDPVITTPVENSKISSPVTITGEAPGVWFSEGQFPVVITDKDEKELGHGVVKAIGEWQTEKPVKFSGTVLFTNLNNVDSGFIIFKKDNPSGDPKNDRRYRISVLFDGAQKNCTKEYKPVCGESEVQCIKAPCPPLKQTYGNRCEAENARAKNITEGECKTADQNSTTSTSPVSLKIPTSRTLPNPVSLEGQAPGTWFGAGSILVEVTDGTGNMLGSARLNAVGEWMTEKMVTFKGSVSYKVPSGVKDGYIVVKKNNASGNPAMDQSVKASVNF
jgi:hypothetical protein